MHRHRPVVRLVALASFATLLAAACGADDEADGASPLEAIFGTADSPAESRAKQLEQEEVVAQCMRENGWEYIPVDYSAQFPDDFAGDITDDPTGEEYGRTYGYGVARSYEIYEWPYLDENGVQTGDGGFGGEGFEDPNMDYVSSLSPSESEEYYAALYGDQSNFQPEFDPVTGDEIYNPPPLEEQGCYGQAQFEVFGDQPWNDPEFGERFGELSQQLEDDPRLETAEIDWSDCMYDISEDYDFFGPQDVYRYVSDLFAEVKGQEVVEVDADSGEIIGRPGEYPEGGYSVDEGDDVGYGYTGSAKRLTEEEIRAFQEREVAIWQDDRSCLEESGYLDLRREIEQELADLIIEEFPDLVADRDADEDAR